MHHLCFASSPKIMQWLAGTTFAYSSKAKLATKFGVSAHRTNVTKCGSRQDC